jgi:hypothetical protein
MGVIDFLTLHQSSLTQCQIGLQVDIMADFTQSHLHASFQAAKMCCSVHSQPKDVRHTFEKTIVDWRLGCSCCAF